MIESKKETKQYTIRFPPEATEALKEMSKEEGVTSAELIRRAINFYQVKIEDRIIVVFENPDTFPRNVFNVPVVLLYPA